MKVLKIHSPPFAGLPTFAKFPQWNIADKSDINSSYGILGIPYDLGTTDYPGTRMAPRQIRSASTQFAYTSSSDHFGTSDSKRGFFNIEENEWILTKKSVYDLGDIEIVAGEPKASFEQIEKTISFFTKMDITPISIGGDHAITYPVLKSLCKKFNDITVIHLDAHMDYWDPGRNSIYDHSCSIWNISRMSEISHIYQFGIRGLNHKPEMLKDAKLNKVTTFKTSDILDNLAHVINMLKTTKNLYITIDIDFFDPSIAPGTGTREMGGLNYRQGYSLLSNIAKNKQSNLIGFDLVEVNPLLDHAETTSLLASRLILDCMGLFEKRN